MEQTKRQPGRPAALTRQMIVDAAMAELDASGVDAVTIRRVAGRLDVSPMALYRHVSDKDELLLALVDRLVSRLVLPARPAHPREAILALWATLYDGLAEYPWLPEVIAGRRLMAPSVLGAVEEIHLHLRSLGLGIAEAATAYRVMWQFTLGTLLVRAGEVRGGQARGAKSVQQQLRGTPDPRRYPTLAAVARDWQGALQRDTYRADLAVLLDGLIARSIA